MGKHSFTFGSVHDAPAPRVVKRAACNATNFYKSPTAGTKVNLDNPFTIEWDTSCFQTSNVDIALVTSNPTIKQTSQRVHTWKGFEFAQGSLSDTINPNTLPSKDATILYHIEIVPSTGGDNLPGIFSSDSIPAIGPQFTLTFNATAAAAAAAANPAQTNSSDNVTTYVSTPKGPNKGQIAAAVIMPILVVAACIAGYVFWSRKKEASRRREYRENLDQRMSIAPGADWAPISAAGAAAAIRHSMAISTGGGDRNTRTSSFFGRQSGYVADPPQEMRQRGRNASTDQSRVSRVSFAETTTSRAKDHPAVPPLPEAYRKSAYSGDGDNLSPTQREGAFALDEDSIRDRLSGASGGNNNGGNGLNSVFGQDADTLPALEMMRANETGPVAPAPVLTRESTVGDYRTYSIGAYSGNTDSIVTDNNSNAPSYFNPPSSNNDPDEALRNYATRTPQMVPVTTTASPFSGFAAGPGLAAAAGFDMSPDAIFRAYAATRPAQPPLAATPGGTPVNAPASGGMRTLYGPMMSQGTGNSNNPYRDSIAGGDEYDVGKAH